MRTGAAANHDGYFHEAVCYSSEEELLAVVLPFLRGGVEAGEPTVVSVPAERADLIRGALPDASGITFLAGGPVYARPAVAIRAYREMLAAYVASGANQVRIVGEMPREALGAATWDAWARYESAVNHAYNEFPLWTLCAYDVRVTPKQVLDDVARTHPRQARPGEVHSASEHYLEPPVFLRQARPAVPDRAQAGPPAVDLTDPPPAAARQAVLDLDQGILSPAQVQDLILAVSEVVSNAVRHGRAPARLRVWTADDRIVVEVSDGGAGPTDPYVGLLPLGDGTDGGLGLWLAHQLCDHVTLTNGEDGFAVRLIVGNPHGQPDPATSVTD